MLRAILTQGQTQQHHVIKSNPVWQSLAGLQPGAGGRNSKDKKKALKDSLLPLGSLCGTVWLRIPSHLADACVTARCGTGHWDLKPLELSLEMQASQA